MALVQALIVTPIIFDKACVWPGDINNDGIVNIQGGHWVNDVLTLHAAYRQYEWDMEAANQNYWNSNTPYNSSHARPLPCAETGITYLYEWRGFPVQDWLKPDGYTFSF